MAVVLQHAQNPPLSPLDHDARESEFYMLPGSTLLLYTDGLVERRDLPLDQGIAGLADIAAAAPRDPEPMLDAVVRALLPGGTHNDDVALLALRRR